MKTRARVGVWQAINGSVTLRNSDESLDIDVFTEVFNGTEDLARVQLSFRSAKGARNAELSASLENAAAADIALQAPALAYLAVLNAPVSGAIRAVFDDEASLERLAATLDIAEGSLDPGGEADPIRFERGRAYFEFDPDENRLDLTEIAVEGERVRLKGDGHAFLAGLEDGGWPESLTAQIRLSEIAAVAKGVFEKEVTFAEGRADLRVKLDPFSVEVGQAALVDGDTRLDTSGTILARPDGWQVSLDAGAEGLDPDRLVALWPVAAIPGTRNWLSQNLLEGDIGNVRAALRLTPGERPRVGLTYDYDNAKVRFLKHFPPITGGRGTASITGDVYAMQLAEGIVTPTEGGPVDLTGSTIRITELDTQPARMNIALRTSGRLEGALSLMDNRPFDVLKKIGRPADMARGNAEVSADIALDLVRRVMVDDVTFSATGRVTEIASDSLVPNRLLVSPGLDLAIDGDGLTLSGPVRLDGVPLTARFTQPFGSDGLAPADVSAEVEISPDTLDAFGITLPRGMVSEAGPARIDLTLPPDAPPEFQLTSATEGLRLSVPALGWSKSPDTRASLVVAGRLGPVPEIDTLSLEAPGLTAQGSLTLGEGGRFVSADFDRVVAGDWLNVPARLVGRGPGAPPRVEITGGLIDVRNLPDTGRGGGGGGQVPITASLDQLIVTEKLRATGVRAELTAGQGLNGRFTALVNNGAAIEGELIPQRGGTAIRVRGNDAGRAFREGGIFQFARDGRFEAVLVPRAEGPGFDGQLQVYETRLNNQPVVLDILDAISVVGIIDQLRGAGIIFENVQARFRILPDRVLIDQGSAVGASLGVSIDGVYYTQARKLDLQGVLSPIYLLNAVGSPLSARRGEGLFGVNFRISGDADAPNVAVNPLSILTPGVFREIFRRAPPSATGEPTVTRRPSQPLPEPERLGGRDDR